MEPRFDLTADELEFIETQDADTEIDADDEVTLGIWYLGNTTLVEAWGEDDNGDPWAFSGRIDPEAVLHQWDEAQSWS